MRSVVPAFVIAGLVAVSGQNTELSELAARATGQGKEQKAPKEPPKSREQIAKDLAIAVGVCVVSAVRQQDERRALSCVAPLLGFIPNPKRTPHF